MQYFKFPMEYLRVTQKYGRDNNGNIDYSSYSHTGSYALDFGGKDTGEDWLYSPCDMVVKRVYGRYNAVWFETVDKVLCADGVKRKLVLMLLHINNRDLQGLGIAPGKIFKQGERFYREGKAAASASHVHLEVGQAPFTPTGWYKTDVRDKTNVFVWRINRQLKPHEMFVLGDDVKILDGGGYNWLTVSDMEKSQGEEQTPAEDEPAVLKSKNARLERENRKLKEKLGDIRKIAEV